MKRFLLITAGTVGGLGAVLSITPPQLGATSTGLGLDLGTLPAPSNTTQAPVSTPSAATTTTSAAPTQSATKTSKPTKSATAKATNSTPAAPTVTATPTQSSTPTPTQTQTSAPTPAPTHTQTPTPTPTKTATPTPTVKTASGTFTGPVVNVNYGNVQVEITVSNGKITDVRALQAPSGRNDRYTNYALPLLKQQTLAAQSTSIQGASGASYTTYGWRKSLQGAMAKAGL
ncbi:MAG: hypothetical protein NTV90_01965 [Actinobacteria bacterium]|nr:hypothetical protein [Actinomycetota bacterium]